MGFLNVLDAIAAPINAVASIGSSLINAHSQKETNKANARINQENNQFNHDEAVLNRDFQSKEAFKTRQFNSQEALAADKRARDLTLEMFNKENQYNTPVNQMKRLREAGINPMSYSNIASINNPASATMASSPSASAGSSPLGSAASAASPIPMQPVNYSNPFMDIAQIRLANANADKAESEAKRSKELLPGEIESQHLNLKLIGADIDLKKSQKNELDKRCELIGSEMLLNEQKVHESWQYQRLMNMQEEQFRIQNKYLEEQIVKNLRKLDDEHRLSDEQIKVCASQITANMAAAYASHQQGSMFHNQALLDGIELKYYDEHGEALLKSRFDAETAKYEAVVDVSRVESLKGQHEAKKWRKRNLHDSGNWMPSSYQEWLNRGLNDLEMISDAVNMSFGFHGTVRSPK